MKEMTPFDIHIAVRKRLRGSGHALTDSALSLTSSPIPPLHLLRSVAFVGPLRSVLLDVEPTRMGDASRGPTFYEEAGAVSGEEPGPLETLLTTPGTSGVDGQEVEMSNRVFKDAKEEILAHALEGVFAVIGAEADAAFVAAYGEESVRSLERAAREYEGSLAAALLRVDEAKGLSFHSLKTVESFETSKAVNAEETTAVHDPKGGAYRAYEAASIVYSLDDFLVEEGSSALYSSVFRRGGKSDTFLWTRSVSSPNPATSQTIMAFRGEPHRYIEVLAIGETSLELLGNGPDGKTAAMPIKSGELTVVPPSWTNLKVKAMTRTTYEGGIHKTVYGVQSVRGFAIGRPSSGDGDDPNDERILTLWPMVPPTPPPTEGRRGAFAAFSLDFDGEGIHPEVRLATVNSGAAEEWTRVRKGVVTRTGVQERTLHEGVLQPDPDGPSLEHSVLAPLTGVRPPADETAPGVSGFDDGGYVAHDSRALNGPLMVGGATSLQGGFKGASGAFLPDESYFFRRVGKPGSLPTAVAPTVFVDRGATFEAFVRSLTPRLIDFGPVGVFVDGRRRTGLWRFDERPVRVGIEKGHFLLSDEVREATSEEELRRADHLYPYNPHLLLIGHPSSTVAYEVTSRPFVAGFLCRYRPNDDLLSMSGRDGAVEEFYSLRPKFVGNQWTLVPWVRHARASGLLKGNEPLVGRLPRELVHFDVATLVVSSLALALELRFRFRPEPSVPNPILRSFTLRTIG